MVESKKPVSILNNRTTSNPGTISETTKTLEHQELATRPTLQSHPSYEPITNSSYVNPQKIAQKLQLITKENDNEERKHVMETKPYSSTSMKTPLTATSVSFTVPEHYERTAHRGSISARPSTTKIVPNSVPGSSITPTNSNAENVSNSSRQNSVHMPGDFIYFETTSSKWSSPGSESLDPILSEEKPNRRQETGLDHKRPVKKAIDKPEPHVPFTQFFQKQDDEKLHILIGATGSVATVKVPLIIDKFFKIYGEENVSIQLVLTKHAEHFLKGAKIHNDVKVWRDEDEWYGFKKMGDPVLHTELRKWADIFLIAPISANTLAKLANGICDNLLTSLLRCWKSNIPVMIAPAMNTFMYIHPVTKKHLLLLEEDYPFIEVLKPVEKVLVCGDIGMGGMREWVEIVELVTRRLQKLRADFKRDDNDDKLGDEEEEGDDEEEEEDDDDDEEDDDDDEEEEEDDDDDDEDDEDDNDNDNETMVARGVSSA